MGHNGNWQQESVYMGKNLVTEFQLFLAGTNGEKPREHQKIQSYIIFFFKIIHSVLKPGLAYHITNPYKRKIVWAIALASFL